MSALLEPMVSTQRGSKLGLSALAVVIAFVAVNAIWGITGDSHTLVSEWEQSIAPLGIWLAISLVVLFGLSLPRYSDWAPTKANSILCIFVVGVLLAESVYHALLPRLGGAGVPIDDYLDPFRFALHRVFFLVPVIPILLLMGRGSLTHLVSLGRWNTQSKLLGTKKVTWIQLFAVVMGASGLVALVMQAGIGFQPIISGWLIAFFPAVLLSAFINGVSEEILFRGGIQPAFVDQVGERGGIGMQALLFGLLHLGSSPTPLGILTTTGAATVLGLLWGYSVARTGSVWWAILTHMAADFTFFAVLYW